MQSNALITADPFSAEQISVMSIEHTLNVDTMHKSH
jgi:hypothetical protein